MKFSRKIALFIALLGLLIALLGGGATSYIDRMFHLDTYRAEILASLQQALQRQVFYEKGEFSLRFGPSFIFTRVVVKEKDGTSDFITADRLALKIEILPLFEKKLVLREIFLDHPLISTSRNAEGLFNFSDLLEEKPEEMALHFKGLRIRKGNLRFLDWQALPGGLATALEDTDLSISRLGRGENSDIKLSAFLVDEGKRGPLSLKGTAQIAQKDKPLSDTVLNFSVIAKDLDTGHYWPYYSRYVPFRKVTGYLNVDSTFKGRLSQFTSRGKVRINGLHFDYPQIFHALLTPQNLRFSYDMALADQSINVKSLDLTVDALNVKGGCAITDLHSGDPRITAHAVTSKFNLEHFAQYIPYGIIVKDPAEYIEQHIKGGIYQLDEGRLDGRVSQIVHMERGDNFNVLFIKGRVEQGLVSYGPDVPSFNSIKGTLEMRGKDFNLIGMSGKFGGSPFTLDGKITDYPLDKPSGYPFSMTMTPRQAEIAWLMGRERGGKLVLAGDSTLRLKGEGITNGYNLAGEWNLTPVAYTFADIVTKPAGRLNLLSFKGSINKQEAHLSSLNYNLSPLSLSVSADHRFAGQVKLAMNVKTNQFPIGDVSAMFPFLNKYQPGGRFQAAVHGESPTADLADLRWYGDVAFSDFSCKPSARIKTVSNMTGTIRFNGTNLETSQLTARVGNSTISGRGSMEGFDTPSLNLVFTSPSINPADFGWHSPQGEVKTGKVSGDISYKDHNLQMRSLSLQFYNSALNIKGTVQDLRKPKADISVTSPHLEVEDIILLSSLEPVTQAEGQQGNLILKARVSADSGKVREIPFTKLSTIVQYEDATLRLQPVECQIFDGTLSTNWRIDFPRNDTPRYKVDFNLDSISADRFMHALGIKKQEVTGDLSLKGEFTAKGRSGTELWQTATGSAKLLCEEGVLKRFPTLSKIFAILNVSILLKMKLPDMVTGGMPYDEISATLSYRDGIITSDDFFIKSDAMSISAVGSMNLIKEEMDLTIGVKPLQTIDKMVSHIPVVGWLITGKDRSFVVAYFEAKGKMGDPTVKAIPVKSLGKGVLGIFKRVFQLPAKLITDTGEVVLGN